jgi:coenzyme F420-0:L-glutamate ligase/coenzyme F420-1:gamma-L-glutamate ligase
VHAGSRLTTAPPDHAGAAAYDLEIAGDPEPTAVAAVCFAHGWRLLEWQPGESGVVARVSPSTP